MVAREVTGDPLYAPVTDLLGQDRGVELLQRLPPPSTEPATRGDVRELAQRMDGLDQRMDGLDQRMDGLDQRMDGLDQRMEGLDQRMDGLEQHMEGLEQRMTDFEFRVTRQLERFDDKLDRFHEGLRDQTRNVLLANAGMMLTLAAILVGGGVVG